jgi:restriction system protein
LIRKHCYGIHFPTASPVKHFKVAKQVGHMNYYLINSDRIKNIPIKEKNDKEKNDKEKKGREKNDREKELLPEEKMINAFKEHKEFIKQQLLDEILNCNPAFFESLVVNLLSKMGYGYDNTASKVTGVSHDGGIDGIIDEDKLGLDKIYLQAKRYSNINTVGRPELQKFVGAMENVQKGVFITTSKFTKAALDYADKQQQKNMKLIDGEMLSELMVRYEVGVTSTISFNAYKIDKDYFSEG